MLPHSCPAVTEMCTLSTLQMPFPSSSEQATYLPLRCVSTSPCHPRFAKSLRCWHSPLHTCVSVPTTRQASRETNGSRPIHVSQYPMARESLTGGHIRDTMRSTDTLQGGSIETHQRNQHTNLIDGFSQNEAKELFRETF